MMEKKEQENKIIALENKVTNIMIGCTKINGLIVHPGKLFLFGNLWDHQKRNMVIKKGL